MDGDDNYEKMMETESSAPSTNKKKLNRLEKEAITYEKAYKKLVIVMIVSSFFVCVQAAGGIISGSIAIFTDTAHLATDMLGFAMSMYALKCSLRPASSDLTYGWHRAEIIGTLASIMFLLVVTVWLLVEATYRIINKKQPLGFEMLVTAILAFCFNLVQMKMLHQGDVHYHMGGEIGGGCGHDHSHGHGHDHAHGHDHGHDHGHAHGHDHDHHHDGGDEETHEHSHGHGCSHGHDHDHHGPSEEQELNTGRNINLDAAFLHALGDMFLSLGVCIAGTIIYLKPEYWIADPICTYVFSIIVFFTVRPITARCVSILMESAPVEIDVPKLMEDIKEKTGAKSVHDFHLWSLSVGRYSMSCHIDSSTPMETLKQVTKLCKDKYKIDHITIQMEDTSNQNEHQFTCEQTTHHPIKFE